MGKDLLPWILGAVAVGAIYFLVLRPGAQNFVNRLMSPEGKAKANELSAQIKSGQISVGDAQKQVLKQGLGLYGYYY